MLIGRYRLFRVIGEGSFSVVRLGIHSFTNEAVAVKIIPKTSLATPEARARFDARVAIVRRLDHPGIVKLLDVLEDDSAIYVVLEYCGGGELFDFITSRSRVEEPLAKRLFKQIVLAVDYLHSQNIIHRDLKPENILLTESCSIKIIDFGFANEHADDLLSDRCGSACYLAPEALGTDPYAGRPTDVWALGVILYALVDGSLPWHYEDPARMSNEISQAQFVMPPRISPQCQDLLRGILEPNPGQRFSADAILVHPWLFGLGNVFITQKVAFKPPEHHVTLTGGNFSASDVRPKLPLSGKRAPPTLLGTILEEEGRDVMERRPAPKPREKAVQPRSISLNGRTNEGESEETDDTNTYHGPIMSQTISHRDPIAIASTFEATLARNRIIYRKMSDLLFQLSATDLQVTAEVCRLYGFRNVYIISFKRVRGESWTYAQFVQSILGRFKPP
jgi:serine/threonine protein kinase